MYGDRSARRVSSFTHMTRGHLYAVKDVVESVLDSGVLEEYSPVVLDMECCQKNVVEELSLDGPSHEELDEIWFEVDELFDEFYSVNIQRVANEELEELNDEALRATRNIRDRGVESTDELLQAE